MQSLQNASQLIGRHERDIPSAAPPNDDYVAVFSYLVAQFREICARLRVSSLSFHIAYLPVAVVYSFTVQACPAESNQIPRLTTA